MRSSAVNGGDVAAAAAAVELLKKANRIKAMPRVLVTGATGQQGGATVAALLAKGGFEIFALSRTPASPKSKLLADKGVRVLQGDFTEPASLQAALRTSKASLVFLVTDFWAAAKQSFDVEVLHGVNMIDAVAAVDPSIFVLYTSVGDADVVPENVKHFRSKAKVEAHLAATLTRWSVLRPVSFLDNFDAPGQFNPLTEGTASGVTPPGLRMKYIATADIGKAAANVLAAPTKHMKAVHELATCEHTGPEIAAALSEASGTPCTYRPSPPRIVQRFLLPDLYNMVCWFESEGGNYSADPAKGRALVGPTALGPKEWFAAKGQWADGRKFGEPAPPSSAVPKALVATAVIAAVVAVVYARAK